MRPFSDRLTAAQADAGSRLCVGLDPDPDRLPASLKGSLATRVAAFNRAIVRATAEWACAYKPNLAFYEALGADGWAVLQATLEAIPPGRLVVVDGKRGDIGNTARRYARAAWHDLGADACTVAPYMGADAVAPFLEEAGRCAFVLAATSNPSGAALQDLTPEGVPVWERVVTASLQAAAGQDGEVGFVVGAQRGDVLKRIRTLAPKAPLLVPGVGAQGGSADDVLRAAGDGPLLVNVGRSILYASAGYDFAEAAEAEARRQADALAV